MEYQKIINFSHNTPNQLNQINLGQKIDWNKWWHTWTYKSNSQIKFKTSMLKSSLCDYSDGYIHVSGTITVTENGDNDAAKRADEREKGAIFKN